MVAQRFEREQSFHIPCEQLKYLGVVKMPQHIHLLFDILAIRAARIIQFLRQPCPRPGPIWHALKIAGIKQLIQQNGVATQIFAGPLDSMLASFAIRSNACGCSRINAR